MSDNTFGRTVDTLADEEIVAATLTVCAATNVGLARENNQDAVKVQLVDPKKPQALLVVADGMGGHENGERASALAVEEVFRRYGANELRGATSFEPVFNSIDRKIHEELGSGGTTMVLVMLRPGQILTANVGDSRAYLLRDGELKQLTVDHSWVQSQVDAGRISAEQAHNHPRRNVLLKALGPGREEGVDVTSRRLLPGDKIMLCSDGLHGVVCADDIAQILRQSKSLDALCDALVEAALKGGGPDNVSVAIAHYQ